MKIITVLTVAAFAVAAQLIPAHAVAEAFYSAPPAISISNPEDSIFSGDADALQLKVKNHHKPASGRYDVKKGRPLTEDEKEEIEKQNKKQYKAHKKLEDKRYKEEIKRRPGESKEAWKTRKEIAKIRHEKEIARLKIKFHIAF